MVSSSTWVSAHRVREICCIGAGFVGGSTGAVLASQLEDVNITVVDLNQDRINAWNSNALPISEPGLDDLVKLGRGLSCLTSLDTESRPSENPLSLSPANEWTGDSGSTRPANLCFTTNIDDSIRRADLIFVCVDTPSGAKDGLLGSALSTKSLHRAVRRVGEIAVKDFILVEKCTVPCGTAKELDRILHETVRPGLQFEVLSNPEFLAEGSAVQDLLHPDRVLIGSFPTAAGMGAAQVLAQVYEHWVPREQVLTIDAWSSELSKLAANALLAQRISSINSLSIICESMNADIRTVSKSCSLDHRIGPHMLNASVGFGGSCFQKDVSYLVYLAASLGLDQVARYWQAVLDMNEHQQSRFADRVMRTLGVNRAAESKIAVLGFAFKANTNDTRNSAAIRIVKELVATGFKIAIYDPCVSEGDIWAAISDGSGNSSDRVAVCASSYEACSQSHAVIVLTEWEKFRYPPLRAKVDIAAMCNDGPPTPDSLSKSELLNYGEIEVAETRCLDDIEANKNINSVAVPNIDERKGHGLDPLDGSNAHIAYTREKQQTSSAKLIPGAMQWELVANLMLEPKQIFDGRNIIADDIMNLGFRIERIGKMSGAS